MLVTFPTGGGELGVLPGIDSPQKLEAVTVQKYTPGITEKKALVVVQEFVPEVVTPGTVATTSQFVKGKPRFEVWYTLNTSGG